MDAWLSVEDDGEWCIAPCIRFNADADDDICIPEFDDELLALFAELDVFWSDVLLRFERGAEPTLHITNDIVRYLFLRFFS